MVWLSLSQNHYCQDKISSAFIAAHNIKVKMRHSTHRNGNTCMKTEGYSLPVTYKTGCNLLNHIYARRTSVYPMVRAGGWGCTTTYKLFHLNFEREKYPFSGIIIYVLYLFLISFRFVVFLCVSFRFNCVSFRGISLGFVAFPISLLTLVHLQ